MALTNSWAAWLICCCWSSIRSSLQKKPDSKRVAPSRRTIGLWDKCEFPPTHSGQLINGPKYIKRCTDSEGSISHNVQWVRFRRGEHWCPYTLPFHVS